MGCAALINHPLRNPTATLFTYIARRNWLRYYDDQNVWRAVTSSHLGQSCRIIDVRLADFIQANVHPILTEWDSFARSIWPAGIPIEPGDLRDSAEEILRAVIADMRTSQTQQAQAEKSKGRGGHSDQSDRIAHASQVHGTARVGSGLALPTLVAEYRALRASVLRLWRASKPPSDVNDLDDLARFNESIDQSLTLAVDSYNRRMDASRSMYLGILGHDLRNPLAAITLMAKLAQTNKGDQSALPQQLSQIIESADAIGNLIKDLLDFTNATLGAGLPLAPTAADLHVLCNAVAGEICAGGRGINIRTSVRGDLAGTWDPHRLRQMIGNLLSNALQHGEPSAPIELIADGTDPDWVVITVHNRGDPIPADVLPTIFDPLVRGPISVEQRRLPGSIGLGLYIVREVATAHGGTAELFSKAEGTTVTVRLPRHARVKPSSS